MAVAIALGWSVSSGWGKVSPAAWITWSAVTWWLPTTSTWLAWVRVQPWRNSP